MKTPKFILKMLSLLALTLSLAFPNLLTNKIKAHTTHEVAFNGTSFSPSNLIIEAGDTVKFVNNSLIALDLASDPHPTHTSYPLLNYGEISTNGGSGLVVFNEEGTFGYHNHENQTQNGTITVKQSLHDITPTPTQEIIPTTFPSTTPTIEPTTIPTTEITPVITQTLTTPTTVTQTTIITPTIISPTPTVQPTNTNLETIPRLEIEVVDQNNKPLSDAAVALKTNGMKKVTDNTGKVQFLNVKIGVERIVVEHNGQIQEKEATITSSTSKFKFEFTSTKQNNYLLFALLTGIIAILIAASVFALMTYKRRKTPNRIIVGNEVTTATDETVVDESPLK